MKRLIVERGPYAAVLPSRFPCWYHAAKAAAFAIEGLQKAGR
jgi:hypothetical protein